MIRETMHHVVRWVLAVWMGVSFLGMARAQDAGAAIAALNQTREYGLGVYRAAVEYEDTLRTHCKNIDFHGDSRTTILGNVKLDASGKIVDGRWQETASGSACGATRAYNVLVVERFGLLTFSYMYPGSSNAGPELQQQTVEALKHWIAAGSGCPLEVLDTHLEGNKSERQPDGSMSRWRESWEVRACDHAYTVPITYLPDPKGISIGLPQGKPIAH